jgi:hypothetical protein
LKINSYLDTIKFKVFEAKHRFIECGKPVTSEAIKRFIQGREEKGHTLLEIFQHHNNQVQALIGIEYAEGTMTKFKTVLNHTREFLKWKYKVDDIEVRKLELTGLLYLGTMTIRATPRQKLIIPILIAVGTNTVCNILNHLALPIILYRAPDLRRRPSLFILMADVSPNPRMDLWILHYRQTN